MLLTITQTDIDQGKRESPRFCPVALALSRQLGINFMVEGDGACPLWPHQICRIYFSKELESWIRDFDALRSALPASFEVTMPWEFDG